MRDKLLTALAVVIGVVVVGAFICFAVFLWLILTILQVFAVIMSGGAGLT